MSKFQIGNIVIRTHSSNLIEPLGYYRIIEVVNDQEIKVDCRYHETPFLQKHFVLAPEQPIR